MKPEQHRQMLNFCPEWIVGKFEIKGDLLWKKLIDTYISISSNSKTIVHLRSRYKGRIFGISGR